MNMPHALSTKRKKKKKKKKKKNSLPTVYDFSYPFRVNLHPLLADIGINMMVIGDVASSTKPLFGYALPSGDKMTLQNQLLDMLQYFYQWWP